MGPDVARGASDGGSGGISAVALVVAHLPAHKARVTNPALFVPVQPMRTARQQPSWRSLFGERLHNSIYAFPECAFDDGLRTRTMAGIRMPVVARPDALQRVLLDNKANYVRPALAQRIMRPVVGAGLLTAEGEAWRVQRRLVAPTFAPAAVGRMTQLIAAASARHIVAFPAARARVDMAQVAIDTTMSIIVDALFSGDPRLATPEAVRRIGDLISAGGSARLVTLLGLERVALTPGIRRARAGRAFLRGTLTALVRERGPSGGADDFFGGLIRALHEQFPREEAETLAVDNAITFYVAGHETTASALAWTIYLLAAQPALQEDARDEAVAAFAGNDVTTLAARMPLLRAILDEALRLYPPAPNFSRETVADDELDGVPIRRGDLIGIFPWVIHRHRTLWTNPDAFDHRRFIGAAKADQHRFQYMPFGAGPRVCVGARFATTEAMIVIAQWLAARRFVLPDGFAPDPVGSVTLRARGGMPLWVEPL